MVCKSASKSADSEGCVMTMRKHADLFATVGNWTSEDGKKHKRRLRCGVLMLDDKSARMSIRLELIPVSPEWHGWISVVPANQEPDDAG